MKLKPAQLGSAAEMPQPGFLYRAARFLTRLYLQAGSHRPRLWNPDLLASTGPVLLFLPRGARLADLMALVAVVPRPIDWEGVVDEEGKRGNLFLRLMYRASGLVSPKGRDPERMLEECSATLRSGRLAAVPLEAESDPSPPRAFSPRQVEDMLLNLDSQTLFQVDVKLLAVHIFHPRRSAGEKELSLHFTAPQSTAELLWAVRGRPRPEHGTLGNVLEQMLTENPFSLRKDQVLLFLEDLEKVLKTDFQERWNSRTDGKQPPEDFRLSGFLVRWGEFARKHTPERLLALAETLEEYQRRGQQLALRRYKLEIDGRWLLRGPRRWRIRRREKSLRKSRRALLTEINQVRDDYRAKLDGVIEPPLSSPIKTQG